MTASTIADRTIGPASAPLASLKCEDYEVASRSKFHDCDFGDYPWDHWRKWAVADGVSEDLEDLGRSLLREADQHSWPEKLLAECGWSDDGQDMIALALKSPEVAGKRWQPLLDTDGGRGRLDAAGGCDHRPNAIDGIRRRGVRPGAELPSP